jgi:SET family sugar efflux transporter-like MFS transporter
MPTLVIATAGRSLFRTPAFIGLLSTNFILGLTSALFLPFGSMWATQEIGMSARGLGLFMTINAASAIALSSIIARWSDLHISRRRLLLVGSLAGAVGHLGWGYLHHPILLTLVGSTLLGVASINFAQLFAHVREELAEGEHAGSDVPFAMGVLRACYALAWIIGPNLGALIKGRFGFQGIFLAAAACFIAFGLSVAAFVRERPRVHQASVQLGLSSGLRQPLVLAHALAFGLMFAAFTLNGLNLPLFLTQKLGGTEQGVGIAFAVSPFFEMLFMVGFGHLATKGYQQGVIRFGICSAVCYFLALRLVTASWQVYPIQILNAAAVAVTASVAIPFFQDLLPNQAGVATSLYSNALKAGGLLGFMTYGLLASHVGNTGLFLVCAALSLTTLAVVVFARHRPV